MTRTRKARSTHTSAPLPTKPAAVSQPTMAPAEPPPPARQPNELGLYLQYILALIRPGKTVRTFHTVTGRAASVGDLANWNSAQLSLLIEEGRQKFENQSARFDRIRQTAQLILPTGVALLVVVGTELHHIIAEKNDAIRYCLYVASSLAATAVLLGTLGSASILVTKAVFGSLFPTLISQENPDELERNVAASYAEQCVVGEDTVNTRLTLQWLSVVLVALGGLLFSALWLFRQLK